MSIQTKLFLSILLSFLALMMGATVFGQTYDLAPVAKQQFLDSNGDPLSSGKIYTYVAGTTTNQATYSDDAGTANANPIVLDSGGFANIWLDASLNYKFKVDSSADVTQYTIDNINSVFSSRTITLGDGTANDARLIFDGNETDYALGLDDSLNTIQLVDESTLGSSILTEWEQLSTGTSGQRVKFYGNNPGTAADNDETYNSHLLENDAGTQVEVARMTWVTLDVSAVDDDSEIQLDTFVNNTFQQVMSIGSASGTSADVELTLNNGTAADTIIKFDGSATDFGFGLDDSVDDICLSDEEVLGTDNLVCFPEVGTGTSVQRMQLYGANTGTPADNDESYQSFFTENDANNQVEIGRISWKALDVSAADDDSQFTFDTFVNNAFTEVLKVGSSSNTATTAKVAITGDLAVSGATALTGAATLSSTLGVSGLATFSADAVINGTTPTLTIGDDGAENTQLLWLGNAQDYASGIVDSDDSLKWSLGATLDTTDLMTFSAAGAAFNDDSAAGHDFRIESDDLDDMFFVNSGDNEIGIGTQGTLDGMVHLLAPGTGVNAIVLEVPASSTVMALEIQANGGRRTFFRAQDAYTTIGLDDFDTGNDARGPHIDIGRNSNSSQASAGFVLFTTLANASNYLHVSSDDKFRCGTTLPIGSADQSNAVCGDQTSFLHHIDGSLNKAFIRGIEPNEGLGVILGTSFTVGEYVDGIKGEQVWPYAEDAPWLMHDPRPDLPGGRSHSPVSHSSLNSLSIQALNQTIEEMKNEIENLKRLGRSGLDVAGIQ
jgi:hypothetical protein